jgi:hypothetical protein
MGFLVNCSIRKISQELSDKLEKLGYENGYDGFIHTEELKTSTFVSTKGFWSLSGFCELWESCRNFHCGTNEKLFLALAALNDTNDFMQWFISEKGDWFLCSYKKFDSNFAEQLIGSKKLEWHKATIEELKEHFKNDF